VDHLTADGVGRNGRAGTIAAFYDLLERPEWHKDALCREFPGLNFFPERGERVDTLKAVCGRCAVRDECLSVALEHNDPFGIWGGTSGRERRNMRRDAAAACSHCHRERAQPWNGLCQSCSQYRREHGGALPTRKAAAPGETAA
jgi:WhiB family redox-sensing transcriptional regulator